MMSLLRGLLATSGIRSLVQEKSAAAPMLSTITVRRLQMQATDNVDILTRLNLTGNQVVNLSKKRRRTKESFKGKPLKRLTLSLGKTAGRNSQGRITAFHRGGGAKRLVRQIDVKRNTSAVGVVERIEYDPGRSSKIALVRWVEGVHPKLRTACKTTKEAVPRHKGVELPAANISGRFSFSSIFGKVDQKTVVCSPTKGSRKCYVAVGVPSQCSWPPNKASEGIDLTSPSLQRETTLPSLGSSLRLPSIALAGARPAFFSVQRIDNETEKETASLRDIQKWNARSDLWQQRMKRKAAIPWQSLGEHRTPGLAGIFEDTATKPTTEQARLIPSQLVADALCSRQSSHHYASKGFYKDILPVVGSSSHSLSAKPSEYVPVSYIPACHQLEVGTVVVNSDSKRVSPQPPENSGVHLRQGLSSAEKNGEVDTDSQLATSQPASLSSNYDMIDLNSNVGNCIPLADIRMGTWIHNIEEHPGQGAKLVRSAGTQAKIVKEKGSHCVVRLPSGTEKLLDSRCRATIGTVSNPSHGARKLRKAGNSRWLGRRPIVRGVAMNPVDHPHGGGEGKTSGGRPSVTPWGKPTKSGYRGAAAFKKRKNEPTAK